MELHGVTVKKVTTSRKSRHIKTKEDEFDEVTVVTQIVLEAEDMPDKDLGNLRQLMYQQSVDAMVELQVEFKEA